MKVAHFARLRTRLYLLVLLTALPGWVLVFYAASEQEQSAVRAIHRDALRTARSAADQEARILAEARQVLVTMADFFQENRDGPIRCQHFFERLLNGSRGYANLGAVGPDGAPICSARPLPAGTNLAQRHWFQRAKAFRDFAMGGYHLGSAADELVLYLAQPVLDETRRPVAVVFAALNLDWLNRLGFSTLADLPEHSTVIQIDQTGVTLSYNPHTREWSEKAPVTANILKDVLARKSGVLEARGTDGVPRLFAFAPLASSLNNRQIILIIAMPRAVAFAAANRNLTRNLSLLGAVTLLALLFAWKGSEVFMLRQVRALASASRRLADGDLSARIGLAEGQDELSQLSRTFDEMALALESLHAAEKMAGEKIRQSREQLRHLTNHLQKVREEERTRIARELHDQFGQALSVLKMDLAWLAKHRPGPDHFVQTKLDAMGSIIDATLHVLHRVCTELRPVILDDFGLAAAIQWQAEDFQKRTGIACRLVLDSEATSLTREESTTVFRIFQEILTNVLRHAAAGEVVIRLREEDDRLMLEVADNGKGITDAQIDSPTSLGLVGMRERVYALDGTIQFAGNTPQGTRVTVAVPIGGKAVSHA
ncbi:MAG: ATP-binding protein [Desulfobacterales bacterium]